MRNVTEAKRQAVEKLCGKGNATVCVGPTGSGKSTSIEEYALSPDVQDLLAKRESDGKGSLTTTGIVVTDHPDIAEDELIVSANVRELQISDVNEDDGEFLCKVLFEGAKVYKKDPDLENYKARLRAEFQASLIDPANNSLGYKLKYLSESEKEEIVKSIEDFNVEHIVMIYDEMIAKAPNNQASFKEFRAVMHGNPLIAKSVEAFGSKVLECLNRDGRQFLERLRAAGAEIEEDQEERLSHFTLILDGGDYDSQLADELLKSEDSSKEYFLTGLFLVFRGKEEFLSGEESDQLIVMEESGVPVKCIYLVDTEGLFHATGVSATEEAERMINILSAFHANRMIFYLNSKTDALIKNSVEAFKSLLSKAKYRIDIYILFTYMDEFMHRKAFGPGEERGRRHKKIGSMDINVDEVYQSCIQEQEELIGSFQEAIGRNNARQTPVLRGCFRAAVPADMTSQLEIKLYENNITYEYATQELLTKILRDEKAQETKFRVIAGKQLCSLERAGFSVPTRALYRDMVVNCMGLRLYASTVRACVRKWEESGTKHISDIKENYEGYRNIRTSFVEEMRHFGTSLLGRIHVSTEGLLDREREEEFNLRLVEYMKACVGREITKTVGQEAHKYGFTGPFGLYQYEYFDNMLRYTQTHFFKGERVVIKEQDDELADVIERAIDKCVRNFIDAKCVEVY